MSSVGGAGSRECDEARHRKSRFLTRALRALGMTFWWHRQTAASSTPKEHGLSPLGMTDIFTCVFGAIIRCGTLISGCMEAVLPRPQRA
jgi:hypothetical protein